MDRLDTILELPEDQRNSAALDALRVSTTEGPIHLLGESFDLESAGVDLLDRVVSMCRMTYRTGFAAVEGYTNDIGWGCMMRTGQTALANVLVRIECSGEDPTWSVLATKEEKRAVMYRQILRWFDDRPEAPFSIQNVTLGGLEFDVEVGKWFGPTTICRVMRNLMMDKLPGLLRVYVSQDTTISDPDIEATSESWKHPTLILIPLRIGLQNADPVLAAKAAETLQWSQSMGIMGGKPRSSYYFVGVQGSDFLYIDPHYPQSSVNMENHEFPIESFHSTSLHRLPIVQMDPSLAVVFVCNSAADYENLKSQAETTFAGGQALFTFSTENEQKTNQPSDLGEESDKGVEQGEEEEDWDIL